MVQLASLANQSLLLAHTVSQMGHGRSRQVGSVGSGGAFRGCGWQGTRIASAIEGGEEVPIGSIKKGRQRCEITYLPQKVHTQRWMNAVRSPKSKRFDSDNVGPANQAYQASSALHGANTPTASTTSRLRHHNHSGWNTSVQQPRRMRPTAPL